ncbi:unnamed protein product [Phytophthora fragariaefolia]|uniref:Unnamed protein product n=1 Tax=Phytophthora fragariaefolia TaxID=1490495 RepID=A0A9W6U1J8_9STRA|nr:unnamed protein product [Phytophthora fragariaefolia]
MPLAALNVTFVSASILQFQLHPWNCWTFEGCDYWEKSTQVSWSNLSANKFARFYESTTCHDTSKKTGFVGIGGDGAYNFPEAAAIRSVMIGTTDGATGDDSNLSRRPAFIYSKCPDGDERGSLGSSSSGDVSVGSVEDTGSSNWNSFLPHS